MKTLIPILILFLALDSCGQKKSLPIKEIKAIDHSSYTYTLLPKQDTLRWYNPGLDTFQVKVTFEKISVGMPMPDVIQNTDNAINNEYPVLIYTPDSFQGDNIVNPLGWTFTKGQLTNVAHFNNTLAILVTDGWVDFPFHGYKIEVYSEMMEGYGIMGVSVDGAPETMVDLYAKVDVNNSTLVFTADSLDQLKDHKIRLRYTGQHNPNTNNDNARITLDKFVVYIKSGIFYPPLPPATYDPSLEKK